MSTWPPTFVGMRCAWWLMVAVNSVARSGAPSVGEIQNVGLWQDGAHG